MAKKAVMVIGGLCLAILAGCGTYGYQQDRSSGANWTVNEPKEVVGIPGSGVYFVPNLSFDLFFYNNSWWSQRGNNWYRSNNYNGPRESVDQRNVPAPVFRIPRNYRSTYEKQPRIPYGQWKNQGKDNKQNNKKDNRQSPGQDNRNKYGQGQN